VLQRQLSHLNGRKLDHRQLQASYILYVYVSIVMTDRLMLFGEEFAVYFENRTEHINILLEENVDFLMLKQVVHIVTIVL
jgi:hypothetical protein